MCRGLFLVSLLVLLGAGSPAAAPRHPYDTGPSWAPDGRRILFDRDELPYVVNRDGTGLRRLTDVPATGSWSRDGRRRDLRRAARKPRERRLRRRRPSPAARTRGRAPETQPGDIEPAWSPDGPELAFVRLYEFGEETIFGRIHVVRADGTHARRLT